MNKAKDVFYAVTISVLAVVLLFNTITNIEQQRELEKIPEFLNRMNIEIDRENDCWIVEWWSHVDVKYADIVHLGDDCN